MPIRKKADFTVQTSAKGPNIKQSGYTFYSYDKDSAALYFQFKNDDGSPVNLKHASVRLLFVLDDKHFMASDEDVEVVDVIHSTARYMLSDVFLKNYTGKITGYVYLDFEDGSRTDDGRFSFTVKRSAIDDVAPQMGDSYVKDFEDVKAEVQEAADKVKAEISEKVDTNVSDIKEAKSTGISNINDYVSEVETSKTTAIENIGGYVSEVEDSKNNAVEDIGQALPAVENEIADVKDLWNRQKEDMIIGGLNLLTGTSDEWEEYTWTGWTTSWDTISLEKINVKPGDTVTYSAELDNSLDDVDLDIELLFTALDENNTAIANSNSSRVETGRKKHVTTTLTLPEETVKLRLPYIRKKDGNKEKTAGIRKRSLQRGIPMDWKPSFKDYDAKIKTLENAIINLGGAL